MSNEPLHLAPKPTDDEGLIGGLARRVLGKSWKTTIAGIVATACGIAPLIPGLPPVVHDICRVVLPIAVGGGFVVAKDKGVTGTQR